MKKLTFALTICLLILSSKANSQANTDANAISVAKNMKTNDFFKHLEYLASDELKGRDTGSEGYAKAADYVANEFRKSGLIPFGDNGTYFQNIELSNSSIVEQSINFKAEKGTKSTVGEYGKNISLFTLFTDKRTQEKQELVFVGYGNILPEENINDYEGVDVKGKTAVVAMGDLNTSKPPMLTIWLQNTIML